MLAKYNWSDAELIAYDPEYENALMQNDDVVNLETQRIRDGVWLRMVADSAYGDQPLLAAALKDLRDAGFDITRCNDKTHAYLHEMIVTSWSKSEAGAMLQNVFVGEMIEK